MKTLDEVIKACEETVSDVDRGVDIEGCFLGATETRDALHYLKHLQEYYNMAREHHEPNPALTWEQLKQMEGKPVWVEGSAFAEGFWTIITGFGKSGDAEYVFFFGDQYWREDMQDADDGVSWQAYRKED